MASSSKDSLKEYVRSMAPPGSNSANIFGLKSWLAASRAEAAAPLLDAEEGAAAQSTPTGGSSDSWLPSGGGCLGLSRKQRIIGFMTCLCLGSVCFTVAGFTLPFIAFKAKKFATLFTLGSVFFMSSFSLLWGPWSHLRHLVSRERLPFSAVYLCSLVLTLYCSLHLHSTGLTIACSVVQLLALVWFLISYLPGGQTGLQFFSSVCGSVVRSTAGRTLPV